MGFNRIFWGLIIIFIYGILRVVWFNVIGYSMIYFGLCKLAYRDNHFKLARNLTFYIFILSVCSNIYQLFIIKNGTNLWIVFDNLLIVMSMVIYAFIIYNICKGVFNIAWQQGHVEFCKVINNRYKLFLISHVLYMFFVISTMTMSDSAKVQFLPLFIVIVFIGNIISTVLLIGLMHQACTSLWMTG
ncbi:hypothetical protein [Petroclostridium xylanilyticum]|jgi:hypothetical protein|uniref:hypothetical protein n=1 Tax=Petroclostridium xylanilyticum TaxID=1792311 RepID=UPI000B9968E6|nr:hypothetical protein [Petroclostridium xylanilyticum]